MAGAAFGANPFSSVPVTPAPTYAGQTVAPRPAQTSPSVAFLGTTTPASMPTAPAATGSVNLTPPPRQPLTSGAQSPALAPPPPPAAPNLTQTPGANMTDPGYSEQTFNATQNRLAEDPFQTTYKNAASAAGTPSQGENFLNQNLGTLNGPGQGEQYWNQQQGQFNSPFAGEQFARQATQNLQPSGPASAFFNQAQQQYGNFTGFQGPQAGAGQYSQNAASGPLSGQNFYNQVQGQLGTTGTYSDPNLAAGQYAQTQQAFGALPGPNSADPFYDRSIQLGTQAYNQNAAGRGVYGSSEALNGVGNVITDLNARRAQNAFQNDMAVAQEQRARQQLLGEQARMGDLSSLAGFGANLSGLETFGNLANAAGNQTLGQQTMLGNQATNVDTAAQNAQNSNIAGLNAFGNLAGQADTSQTNRFTAGTNAMNQADQTAINRLSTGANIANQVDSNNRANFEAQNQAATAAGNLQNSRINTQVNAASAGSASDLARLTGVNAAATGAEADRTKRLQSQIDATFKLSSQLSDTIGSAMKGMEGASQQDFENMWTTELAPKLTAAGYSKEEQTRMMNSYMDGLNIIRS